MARSTTLDARLVCRICGQSWPDVEQACACDIPISKCCNVPLHREYWTPQPTSAMFINLFWLLAGFLLGGAVVNFAITLTCRY